MKRTGWLFKTMCLLFLFGTMGCGINEQALAQERMEYPANVPDWFASNFKKKRYIKVADGTIEQVSSYVPQAIKQLNEALDERFKVKNRFNLLEGDLPSDGFLVSLRVDDDHELCKKPDGRLAFLDKNDDASAYEIVICHRKIVAAKYLPATSQNEPQLYYMDCIIAHEIMHSDMLSHPTWACGLMCAKPTSCYITEHMMDLWGLTAGKALGVKLEPRLEVKLSDLRHRLDRSPPHRKTNPQSPCWHL